MKTRLLWPVVAALIASFFLPSEVFAKRKRRPAPIIPVNTNFSSTGYSQISGGFGNLIEPNSPFSVIAGGNSNIVSSAVTNGVIGGGWRNIVGSNYAAVSGGEDNWALGLNSVVAGGYQNTASNSFSAVGGGLNNSATASYATVPGGYSARATNMGAFVWSGGPINGFTTDSTNDFSFTVRAVGGVRFITTTVDSRTVLAGTYGAPFLTNGVFLPPNSGAWESLSDSNAKTGIKPIDVRKILSKVAAMPVSEWKYKVDPERRYIGPMAQDFHAAFGLGRDDKSISTLDSDGVMYAAIQGLVEELKERDKATAVRDQMIEELKTELQSLREEVHGRLPPAP